MESDFKEFVLGGGPLLNLVVSSHLLAENYLRKALTQKLVYPNAVLTNRGPSFSALVSWCEALGVLRPDVARVLHMFNSLRNKYAHHLAFEASRPEVEAFLVSLREMEDPFYISHLTSSEHELARSIASLSGWLQRAYGPIVRE